MLDVRIRMTEENRQIRIRRLIYRSCYTGTRETDMLLGQFAAQYLPDLNHSQLDECEQILEEGDPNILAWVRGDLTVPDALNGSVFQMIKSFKSIL